MKIKKHPNILVKENSALLMIDVQERILKVINQYENLLENTKKLILGFNEMSLPIYYTEQYPKGLGGTVEELKEMLVDTESIQKMTFSCSGAGDLFENLKKSEVRQVVVCGIESHVCVQQTVLDLIANDFKVFVAADAVSSRKEFDYNIAIERMRTNGAEITTTEAILFELLNICGTPEFKAVAKLIK